MSIHKFSESAFNDATREIIIEEGMARDYITNKTIKDSEKIEPDASFREKFDMSSLDIAELVIGLEEKYNIKTLEERTSSIDSIDDVRKLFFKSLDVRRRNFVASKQIQKQ